MVLVESNTLEGGAIQKNHLKQACLRGIIFFESQLPHMLFSTFKSLENL